MDDDDAFLYGDDGSEAPHPADAAHAVPPPAESKPPDDDNGNSSVMEESDEEDSSDEDLEIVMDAPDATAKPVSAAKNNVPIQPQMLRAHIPGAKQPLPTQLSAPPAPSPTVSAPSPISKQPEPSGLTSDYTPLSRTSAVQNSTVKIPQVPQEDGLVHTLPEGAEGPPPSAPATAPTLHMEPTMSDLQVSDMDLPGGGPGAQTGRFGTTNLYHLDPASMASKPWRRPGADLTDWFNYGFDEASWARWATHQRQIMAEKQNIDAQAANEGFYANFDPAMGMLPGMNPEQIIATMPAPLQAQVNQQLTTLQQQMLQAQLGMMYTGGGAGAGAAPGAGTGGPRSVPPGPPPSAPPGPSPAIAGGNNAHGATGAEPYGPMPAIHIGRGPPGSAAPVLPNYGDEEWDGNPGNRQRELEPGFDDGSRARSRPPLPPPSFPGSRGGRVPRRLKGRHELDHFEGETGSGLDYSYSYDEPVPPTRDSRSQPSHRDRSQNKDERNSRRSASPNAQGPPANQREYDNSESFERRDDRAGERSTRPTRWA